MRLCADPISEYGPRSVESHGILPTESKSGLDIFILLNARLLKFIFPEKTRCKYTIHQKVNSTRMTPAAKTCNNLKF